MNRFFQMKADSDSAELYIYGDIVGSDWDKWSNEDRCPQDIVDFVKSLNGQPLDIHINSCGGDVFGGIAIYNILKGYKGKKTAYIDGLAASIASVIALSADDVVMLTGSQFMIHKPWSCAMGDAESMRHTADLLDGVQEQILDIYAKKSISMTSDELNELINAETWMSGKEASEIFGFELDDIKMAASCRTDFADKFKNAPEGVFVDGAEPEDVVVDETDHLLKEKLQIELNLY